MIGSIKVLHLEDIRSDADIVRREMAKSSFRLEWKWVSNKTEYEETLESYAPDVVLSDHSLPGYTSIDAMRFLKSTGIDAPFILITSTVSEEFAVMMMKEGIADYLLKDRLQRLTVAVTNALELREAERQRRVYFEEMMLNEKRFRGLIENSRDLIGITDQDLYPIYASPSYEKITGWTLSERKKIGAIELVHPDDRRNYQGTLNQVTNTPGTYFPLEYRMRHREGNYIWMKGTVINMLSDEALQGIVYNLRDVTSRKATEESLKLSEANLSAIIENANISIYSIDRQFRYITFNSILRESLKEAYGLDVKVGDVVFAFLDKLDPAEANAWRDIYMRAFAGESVSFEKEFALGDFHSYIRFAINPIRAGDFVTGLSCLAWDITQEKVAALQVAKSEARFRALIENNFDAITLRDENLRLIYASPSVSRITGFHSEELLMEGSQGLATHPEDTSILQKLIKDVLANPGKPFSATVRIRHANGHYVWMEGVLTNMLANESVKGIVANFRDVTERKETELQLERITRDLIERNKNLEQYAYIVSHNLRGPVANILGISNLLEMPGAELHDKEESLTHLFLSVKKLDGVIKDLSLILQMNHGIDEQREPIYFETLVNDIKLSLSDLLDKNRTTVITDFDSAPSTTTVRSYAYSIFYNLITNAIKYRRDNVDNVIKIQSHISDQMLELTFSDNGLGIDLQTQGDKVFGLYNRFHADRMEGKGVGLFMTKAQVDTLGGKITVRSEVNKGTEFKIQLPCTD